MQCAARSLKPDAFRPIFALRIQRIHLMPDKTTPFPDYGFRVDWAKLNNELFGAIYADPELRARYDRADSHQAQLICSDLFDMLVKDASEFVERFIILTES